MAEVNVIINSRPLLPISGDTESPFILSPVMLLTQKAGVTAPIPELNLKGYTRLSGNAYRFSQRRCNLDVFMIYLIQDTVNGYDNSYNFKSLMNKPKITTFVASICHNPLI